MAHRGKSRSLRASIYDAENSLGLKEVHLSIQDGAPGEFSGIRGPSARSNEQGSYCGWRQQSAVATDLNQVFTRK